MRARTAPRQKSLIKQTELLHRRDLLRPLVRVSDNP
jgi:hypothetical protein